jgi:hypothetical protein
LPAASPRLWVVTASGIRCNIHRASLISIQDQNATDYPPIDGYYSVLFWVNGFGPPPQSDSLSQAGLVPVGAQSIQMKNAGTSSFVVTVVELHDISS